MSEREWYPAGVPCWVETLRPHLSGALDFYGALFGWAFDGPSAVPGDPSGQYYVAQIDGRDVAGIGSLPDGAPHTAPIWLTSVRVDDAEATVRKAMAAGGTLRSGPHDALPAGRSAVLADPAGARVGIWEARAREGSQLINESRAWALSSLRSTDQEGSKRFYGSVFGWQPEAIGPPGTELTLWRLPGYVGGQPDQPVPRDAIGLMTPLGDHVSPDEQESHWSVDFFVHDVDEVAEDVVGLGGKILVPPHDTPGFRSAEVADHQGAVFSISMLSAGADRAH